MDNNNVAWGTGTMPENVVSYTTVASSDQVPFIVYEGTIARLERTIKRLIILIGITILLLFASNAIWIYEWNQYDYADVTMDNTDGGNANFMGAGASGVINNGESQSKDKD